MGIDEDNFSESKIISSLPSRSPDFYVLESYDEYGCITWVAEGVSIQYSGINYPSDPLMLDDISNEVHDLDLKSYLAQVIKIKGSPLYTEAATRYLLNLQIEEAIFGDDNE